MHNTKIHLLLESTLLTCGVTMLYHVMCLYISNASINGGGGGEGVQPQKNQTKTSLTSNFLFGFGFFWVFLGFYWTFLRKLFKKF